jgi:hypothetical protein
MAALDVSNLILLVSTLDIPAIARMRKFVELVPLLNLDPQRVMLVINQHDQRVGITPEKLAHAFGKEAEAADVEQFIYTSSIKTVGVLPGEAISDEETVYNLWNTAGDYGRSKYLAEKLLLEPELLCACSRTPENSQ